VNNIFRVKGRPQDNPLIVHLRSLDQAWLLARSIPVMFWVLAEHFLPGPLTVVLKKSGRVPDVVTAGLGTVAIRFPDHPIARALLKEAGVPIVAPSANLSGRPSPTTAQHVGADLDGKIAAILDGGPCKIGVESTVLDITRRIPVILRPGGVTREQLEKALSMRIRVARTTHRRPASPGMKYRHYAPKAEVILFEGKLKPVLRAMKSYAEQLSGRGMRVGIMAEETACTAFSEYHFLSLGRSGAASAASRLFDAFRTLDKRNVSVILCQGFPEQEIGSALMNRLRKAASRRIRV
jgi:L-threonylcarbamoyladenylate synthase